MNFFKLYMGDYQRDTAHLSLAEHGAYLLMLQHFYSTERPLPTGTALHRMLRAQSKVERDAIDSVATQFWAKTPEGLVNQRAETEIRKSDHQRAINREIGSRGGRPKRTEQETDSVSKTGTEQETDSVSVREPNRNPNQTPDTRQEQDQDQKQKASELRSGENPPEKPPKPVPDDPPAEPPPDPIWGTGLAFLRRKRIPEPQARALLGKLRKACGDIPTGALLAQAEADDITNPAAWLMAAAARNHGPQPVSKTLQGLQILERMKRDIGAEDAFPRLAAG